jgi:hypothetical protein
MAAFDKKRRITDARLRLLLSQSSDQKGDVFATGGELEVWPFSGLLLPLRAYPWIQKPLGCWRLVVDWN